MKTCFKCHKEKPMDAFYKHSQMSDGRLGKCKECTGVDNKRSNGTQNCVCEVCGDTYRTTLYWATHGQRACSNACKGQLISATYERKNQGMKMAYYSVHRWIERQLGKPSLCEFCNTTEGWFDWSNKSGDYLRDVADWQRLCRKCHIAFDDNPTKRRHTLLERYGTMDMNLIKEMH